MLKEGQNGNFIIGCCCCCYRCSHLRETTEISLAMALIMYSPWVLSVQCRVAPSLCDLGSLFFSCAFDCSPVPGWLDHSAFFCCCMLWSPRSCGRTYYASVDQLMKEGEGARASERTHASRSSAILLLTQQLAQQLTHAEARARGHSCPRFVLACR